jgi:gentisate 1,2-dioxygenase
LGDQPMMWMDSLDIPTKFALGGTFFEDYPEYIEPPSVPDDFGAEVYAGGMVRPIAHRKPHIAPVGKYKWGRTLDAINGLSKYDPDPYDGYAVEYINPSNGETANPTIAAWMQKLPAGFRSKAHRHTHSTVYQVFRGSGCSVINGVRFDWSQGDYFVVPNWAWHEHVANEDTFLFSVSDIPIMEKFAVEREEAYESNNGHQEITDEFKPLLPTSNI